VRVLFSSTPAYGHVQPMLPLAIAFRDAGHDVIVAIAPELAPRVVAAGLTAVPAGDDLPAWWQELERRHPGQPWNGLAPERILHWFIPHLFAEVGAPAMLRDLRVITAGWRPDLIVYESFEFAGPVAAALCGARAVQHTLSPLPDREVLELTAEAAAPLWTGSGLRPPASDGLAGDPCLDVCPPSLRNPAGPHLKGALPLRPVPVNGAANETLPACLDRLSDQPTVHVTLGTSVTSADQSVLARIIDGLRDEPVNLAVTVGPANDPGAFGAQPPHVCIERYLPHALLLPRCALVISHGGAGTMLAALAHGLPLLTIPQGADQYLNADTCARRGVGRTLLTDHLTPDTARREVRLLLEDDGHRRAAREVSAEIDAMPAPATVVQLLQRETLRS
jgi:UDP:flavonoid glycosyltransferase YjiC (YdhE family)